MTAEHPFAALDGTWRGTGHGEYPTIDGFDYAEELVIGPVPGRPVAHWRSTTRDVATGEPRHAESGFLRAATGSVSRASLRASERIGSVELVVAHGFGIVEAAAGSFDGQVLGLRTTGLLGTASAKRVDLVVRRYELDGMELRYDIAMAAVGVDLTHHLRGELRRV